MQQSVQSGLNADALIAKMGTAICLLNTDGTIAFANNAFDRLFSIGKDQSTLSLIPFFLQKRLRVEDALKLEQTILDVHSGESKFNQIQLWFEFEKHVMRCFQLSIQTVAHQGASALLLEFQEKGEQVLNNSEVFNLQEQFQFAAGVLHYGIFEYDFETRDWIFSDSLVALTCIDVNEITAGISSLFKSISKSDKIKLLRSASGKKAVQNQQHFQIKFQNQVSGNKLFDIYLQYYCDENGRLKRLLGVLHDITKQHQINERLQLEQAALLSMMDAQRSLIVRIDKQGNIIQANTAFRRLFSIGVLYQEKSNILEIFPSNRIDEFRKYFSESIEFKRNFEGIEIICNLPDHSVLNTEWDIVPIESRFGTYDEIQLIGVDYSIVDDLSRELESTNSNLRSLINNFQNVSIWSVDQNLKLVAFNEHFKHEYELFWGISPTVGDEIYKVTRPDQEAIKYWGDQFQRALRGEYFFIEYEMDGSFFEVSFSPIELNGTVVGVACYGQDVSRQKQIERRLRLNEERWKFAVEGNHYGLWEWDADRDKLYFSPTCFSMLGYSDGEALEESAFAFFKLIHPSDIHHSEMRFKQILKGEINEFNVEMRLLDKSGQFRWILNKGRVFKSNADGTPQRVLGIWSDISQKKSAEQLIRKHMENLEKFASITSHELRHPAASIMGIVRQLNEPNNADEDVKILFSKLTEASEKLDDIITEMNSLLRPGSISNTQSTEINSAEYGDNQIQSVWLIDDDMINNVLNERLFRKFRPNIKVRSFTQAEDVLYELKDNPHHRPDLILLDINMPGMNGWDFLDEIIKERINLKVFMLSSSIDPKDFERAKGYSMVKDYIAKPLKEDHLIKFSV